MIFFLDNVVGLRIINFILRYYKKDIKGIVIKKSDKLIKNKISNKIAKDKIFYWNKNLEKKLKAINPNLFILVWWPYILKKKLLTIPSYSTINLHPSLLPFYKGKDPNFWSILNNGPYGVSIHVANQNIDSGDIIFQKKIKNISYTVDAKELYLISQKEIIKLFKLKYSKIRKLDFKKKYIKNLPSKAKTRKNMLLESNIDLNKNYKGSYLINLLRAKNFYPYDGVRFEVNKDVYSINIKIRKLIN